MVTDRVLGWCCGGGSSRSSIRCRVGSSNLDRDNTAEGTSTVGVGHLDQAHIGEAVDGTGAGGTGRHGESNGEVLVDVGGAPGDDACSFGEVTDEGLLAEGTRAVAVVAGDVLGRREGRALAELASGSRVKNGLHGTATICGHDVEGTRQAAAGGADLGKNVAREGLGLRELGNLDCTRTSRLAKAVGRNLGALEDSGINLGLREQTVSCKYYVCDEVSNIVSKKGERTFELEPVKGTTPPWLARAVPLPPRSPTKETGLPWPATRGMAARARTIVLEYILKD